MKHSTSQGQKAGSSGYGCMTGTEKLHAEKKALYVIHMAIINKPVTSYNAHYV